jgi:SAM-dependent methyltransferase
LDAYGEDLTSIHDLGFSTLAEQAAGLAVELLAEDAPGTVVELGSGGGVTAAQLAAAGHSVTGFDLSADQIELARARVPAADFTVASFVDAELPSGCSAVLAVGEVFNYAFDERADSGAVEDFFVRAFAALRPGGFLLFDAAGPGRVPGADPVRNHAQGDGWAVLFEARELDGEVVREITTFREIDGRWRRGFERHRLRLHHPSELEAALRAAGFEVEIRVGYGSERFAPGLAVFLARKGPPS